MTAEALLTLSRHISSLHAPRILFGPPFNIVRMGMIVCGVEYRPQGKLRWIGPLSPFHMCSVDVPAMAAAHLL